MKVVALIPAAGMGKRMGAGMNKQYLLLGGLPIVGRTLSVFQKASFVDDIYVISPEDEIPYCRENVVAAMGLTKVRAIVAGGAERQHSVHNGLQALTEIDDDDIVLIHDGVRPFIRPEILGEAIATARISDGALVAVPAKDTIKVVTNGIVSETPPRDTLWLAQTPQAFRFGIIARAHRAAAEAGFLGTDDASLVERLDGSIRIVMGDYRNIKITTPEDMLLGETLLQEFPL